jgi:hypothetical protein
MNPWLIWLLAGCVLCGCQAAGGPVSDDCPSPNPCDDPGQQALQPRPVATPEVAQVAWKPLWPGCPSTLQVMAQPTPIVFHAVRPEDQPEAAPDPSDWVCELPEAPLQRAGAQRTNQVVTTRQAVMQMTTALTNPIR